MNGLMVAAVCSFSLDKELCWMKSIDLPNFCYCSFLFGSSDFVVCFVMVTNP